ncbi:MAG TPA: FtsX-like permease family protein [Gemmataceae bacterium]|jgi:putative ABC transport system permease protein
MKTPLVLLNFLHQPVRTTVAILGVAFAILLVFMQLGFYGTAELSATTVYDALDFDLLVRSRDYVCVTDARSFPRYRLQQALGHADVSSASPVYLGWQLWRDPQGIKYYGDTEKRNYRRAILVFGFNLKEHIFNATTTHGEPPTPDSLSKLSIPNSVLVDTYTRRYFGKHDVGTQTELNGVAITVEGAFTIGPGLGADGLLVMSDRTYARLAGASALERPSLGLIKLKSGAGDRAAVREELKNYLYSASGEVDILTRDEVEQKERDYWLKRTPVGVIFKMGVAVACLVGIVFVYQVITTDITDHSAEYATLKAMGYSSLYLSGVVLRQAVAFAVLGYVPGLLASLLLYWLGRRYEQILLFATWERAAGVLILSIAMCSLSGLLAIYKVKAADPAELF